MAAEPRHEVDKDWFTGKLQAVGKSQAALARHLGLQPSGLSLRLDGRRRFKLEEAEAIARFLGTSTEEVLQHAGVKLTADQSIDLELRRVIDGSGRVTQAEPMVISTETMNMLKANIPMDRRGDYELAIVQDKQGALWQLDDNVVLFETPTRLNPGPASVLSVSRLRDGLTVLGKVTEWSKTGAAKIRLPDGTEREVELAASSPVKLIVP